MTRTIETDVLVVGAGPAGATAAVFLGRVGVRTLMISRYRGTADTPRAHIVSQRAMEVLRDAGLEQKCLAMGYPASTIGHTFWMRNMSGDELARTWAWGNDPARCGDYVAASPCEHMDLPQTELEPILVSEANKLGVQMRFGWELESFTQDEQGVTAQILDRLSESTITVRARYMVGADGARSRIAEQLGLSLTGIPVLGDLFSVFCEIDLSRYVAHRPASLYNVVDPDSDKNLPVAEKRCSRSSRRAVPPKGARPGSAPGCTAARAPRARSAARRDPRRCASRLDP